MYSDSDIESQLLTRNSSHVKNERTLLTCVVNGLICIFFIGMISAVILVITKTI